MSKLSDTAIGELSTEEILDHLAERLPVYVFAGMVPDDNDECETICSGTGNRATRLGLSELLRASQLNELLNMGYGRERPENDEDGDDASESGV